MKFFKQIIPGSCNIIAIQHVLSFFEICPTFDEIQKDLPTHEFGNWLTEIWIYLESKGIRTKLISNSNDFTSANKAFIKTLNLYKRLGTFEDRLPTENDITKMPIIINIDARKIRKENGNPLPHYVVCVRNNNLCYLYDGNNFNDVVETTYDELYNVSLKINDNYENGMWLVLI